MENTALSRMAAKELERRLRVMPAVVVSGARQTGKSTLAIEFAPDARRFLSFDDTDVAEAARDDPSLLLGDGGPSPSTRCSARRRCCTR